MQRMSVESQQVGAGAFSEREFYLREFRGRTLAVALPASGGSVDPEVLQTLARGGCRSVVLATGAQALEALGLRCVLSADRPRLEAELWRALRTHSVVGLELPAADFLTHCRGLALRLRVFKLVCLDAGGGLLARGGKRRSFVHLEELRGWLGRGGEGLAGRDRLALWSAVARMLEGGLNALNVRRAEDLARELFTYAGSGTLFTRERYMEVRRLGLDDFDAAHDLIRCGVEEGYLVPRGSEALDAVLAAGFGAFALGRDLAGIGALLPGMDARAGEICSLYTLTRFLGEGVGKVLIGFACEEAARKAMSLVYACTTSERVGEFFQRNGFRGVGQEEVPAEKWRGYDPARRSLVRCYRRDLS